MNTNEQINEPMGRALNARLRGEGRHIKSTVAPKEWAPTDAELVEAAALEQCWMNGSRA